jgi:hypothetical protein
VDSLGQWEEDGLTTTYTARIADAGEHGVRLEPGADAGIPERPSETNLLALAVALAMGSADYEHHPEPRDPEIQTLEGLLDGTATMPWRAVRADGSTGDHYVVCTRSDAGAWRCRVEVR